MDPALDQVGARLKAARHRVGLTLDELAARTGVSASTVSRLESGRRQANLELLVPLTRQLGITLDDLVECWVHSGPFFSVVPASRVAWPHVARTAAATAPQVHGPTTAHPF